MGRAFPVFARDQPPGSSRVNAGGNQSMRVGKGLFRLWIIGAVLWFFAIGAWLRPDRAIEHLWFGPSHEELAMWGLKCADKPSAPDCASLITQWDALSDNIRAEYTLSELAEMRSAWWSAIRLFVMCVIGPALALLSIGAALLWAMRGFRDGASSQRSN